MIQYRLADEFPGYRVGSDGSLWSGRRGGKWKRRRLHRNAQGYLSAMVRRDWPPSFKPINVGVWASTPEKRPG